MTCLQLLAPGHHHLLIEWEVPARPNISTIRGKVTMTGIRYLEPRTTSVETTGVVRPNHVAGDQQIRRAPTTVQSPWRTHRWHWSRFSPGSINHNLRIRIAECVRVIYLGEGLPGWVKGSQTSHLIFQLGRLDVRTSPHVPHKNGGYDYTLRYMVLYVSPNIGEPPIRMVPHTEF